MLQKGIISLLVFLIFLVKISAYDNIGDTTKIVEIFLSYQETKSKKDKVALANEMMQWFFAQDYMDTLLIFSTQTPKDSLVMHIEGYMASYYYEKANYENAEKYALEALSIANSLKDTLHISENYGVLSCVYIRTGESEKAVDILTKDYQLAELSEDKEAMSSVLNNMGGLYLTLRKNKMAVTYYEKALSIERTLQKQSGRDYYLAIRLRGLAEAYEKNGRNQEALELLKEALLIDSNGDRPYRVAINLSNIGKVYRTLKEYGKAENYFRKAITTFRELNKQQSLAISLSELGELYQMQNRNPMAIRCLEEALELCNKYGMENRKLHVVNELYRLNKDKNPQQALIYLEEKNRLKDSIYQMKIHENLNEFQVKYKTKEREQQIVLQKMKIENRTKLLWILFILSFVGIIFTFFIYRLWQSRNRKNYKLEQLNNTKDKLFSIISHDLKSPVIAQKMALENLINKVKVSEDETVNKYYTILHENTENQITVIENLMNWAQLQTDKIQYNPQIVDIVLLIKEEIKLYVVGAQQKSIKITTSLPEKCFVYIDRQMIGIVIRNLINNAVKFTREGGAIKISCECRADEAVFMLVDDGIGMSMEQISALYTTKQEIEVGFGTKGEKGTGLGLILCKDLLERNHSRLLIESSLTKGTTMRFTMKKTEN